jgi:nitroreductase
MLPATSPEKVPRFSTKVSMRRFLRSVYRGIRFAGAATASNWERLAVKKPFLSSVYYAIVSPAFHREHRATLAGKAHYHCAGESVTGNATLLRRNIHRIEKGLLMRPRRGVFGLEYAAETVESYRRRLDVDSHNPDLRWAHDVLSAYFDATKADQGLAGLRDSFRRLPRPDSEVVGETIPYRRRKPDRAPVAFNDLLQLVNQRRSVRWFLPRLVPRNLIEQAIKIASLSPTACNRQPFLFRVFDDQKFVRDLASIPMGTTGYADNIPMLVVVVGQLRHFFDERDRHLIYIDGSLACMSFVLALETLGLASCIINWPDLPERESKLAKLIDLEADERPVMLIAVGYPDPDGLVAASVKKPIDQLIRYN